MPVPIWIDTPEAHEDALSQWAFWWEFNKVHFCPGLRAKRRPQGAWGSGIERESRWPTRSDVEGKVIPALSSALEASQNVEVNAALLIALGRTGDPLDSTESLKVLRDAAQSDVQELQLAGILALGLFGDPRSVPDLLAILNDTPVANGLDGSSESVRAYAACALGLLGSSAADEGVRRAIVASLVGAFEDDDSPTDDVKVACLIALGFVPLNETTAPDRNRSSLPTSHAKQCAYLLAALHDTDLPTSIRAQAPLALSHLFRQRRSEESRAAVESAVLKQLATSTDTAGDERIAESCALALGQLGASGPSEFDARIRKALIGLSSEGTRTQLYGFAIIALAQLAGQRSSLGDHETQREIASHLEAQLAREDMKRGPWAGLAAGLFARTAGAETPTSLIEALKTKFSKERTPLAAAYAIGVGLSGDSKLVPVLLAKLNDSKNDDTRGCTGLALGMLGARDTRASLIELFEENRYRQPLLERLALALGQLGGKTSLDFLLGRIPGVLGKPLQSSIALAISDLDDRRAIGPLCTMLADERLEPRARALAATALGLLASKRPLPWHDEFAAYFNYRAATKSLMSFDLPGLLLRP
jgi:HEAT repeat protein